MALGKYNRRTVSATSGAVVPEATVSFYDQLTGLPATAYNDPDGLDPIGSSTTSGSQGELEVFLVPGKYRITVEKDDLYEEITYEPVTGDIALVDADEVGLNFLALATPAANSIPRILPNGFTELRTVAQTRSDLGLGGAALLNVGTTTGTVAAGDDSRLSDSREWTAATVDQAEAEAGVATTRRAWTAERVRQAIVAVGTTVGKALLNLTDPSAVRFLRINADNTVTARSDSEMRTDLGLGSAALLADTAVVQTTGDQTVTGVKTVTSQMKLQNGGVTSGTAALLMGADATATTLTDATNKQVAISLPHYTLAEEPILMLRARSLVSSTVLQWGGGLAAFNAATQHVFLTAADNVTTTGTATFTIASNAVSSQVQLALPSYTVATLPTGVTAGMVFVSDESGGSVPAFYDGTDWRRVTDRAIVS